MVKRAKPRPRRSGNLITFRRQFILAGGLAAALGAIVTLWQLVGWPVPAWSTDLRKLDLRQTEQAIDLYSKALDDAIIRQDLLRDPSVRALNAKKIDDAQKKLDQLRNRQLELEK